MALAHRRMIGPHPSRETHLPGTSRVADGEIVFQSGAVGPDKAYLLCAPLAHKVRALSQSALPPRAPFVSMSVRHYGDFVPAGSGPGLPGSVH